MRFGWVSKVTYTMGISVAAASAWRTLREASYREVSRRDNARTKRVGVAAVSA